MVYGLWSMDYGLSAMVYGPLIINYILTHCYLFEQTAPRDGALHLAHATEMLGKTSPTLRRSAAAACAAVATCAPACSASEVNMRRILIAPRPLYVHIDVWPIAAAQEGAGRPAATSWPVLDGMPPRSRGKGATYARRIRAAPVGGSGIALINKYVAHSPASRRLEPRRASSCWQRCGFEQRLLSGAPSRGLGPPSLPPRHTFLCLRGSIARRAPRSSPSPSYSPTAPRRHQMRHTLLQVPRVPDAGRTDRSACGRRSSGWVCGDDGRRLQLCAALAAWQCAGACFSSRACSSQQHQRQQQSIIIISSSQPACCHPRCAG
jgi:hypothetical protein